MVGYNNDDIEGDEDFAKCCRDLLLNKVKGMKTDVGSSFFEYYKVFTKNNNSVIFLLNYYRQNNLFEQLDCSDMLIDIINSDFDLNDDVLFLLIDIIVNEDVDGDRYSYEYILEEYIDYIFDFNKSSDFYCKVFNIIFDKIAKSYNSITIDLLVNLENGASRNSRKSNMSEYYPNWYKERLQEQEMLDNPDFTDFYYDD
jgi:hypothetical protein